MTETDDADSRHIYERRHETVAARDIDGLTELYAGDAILEPPLVLVTLQDRQSGLLRGRAEIRRFFAAGLRRSGNRLGAWYRTGTFCSNGRQLTWEYPRATPQGDQVDLVEEMDIADGRIVHHRVYWGWEGFRALLALTAP